MIINGNSRGNAAQLADHLLRADQNESIRLYETRGTVAGDARAALREMEAHGASLNCKRPLYHASISPEAHTPLTDPQIRIAVDTLAAALDLEHQPRIVIVHRKKDREHIHVVWSRVDQERQRTISDSWNYRHHEQAARTLEALFGHRPVPSSDERHRKRRRTQRDYEARQQERTGVSPSSVTNEITAIWCKSGRGPAFRSMLEAAGYRLARGDRRVFVVIDRAGNAHSLARRLGVPTGILRARLGDLDPGALPAVSDVRSELSRRARPASMRTAYRAAAREVVYPVRRLAGVAARPTVHFQAFRAAVNWINLAGHAPEGVARVTVSHYLTLARLRGLRAAILGDFAARMDDAARLLSDEALLAALKRLADERDAALRTLKRLGGTQTITIRRRIRRRRRFSVRKIIRRAR
jgi:hypothetical protein